MTGWTSRALLLVAVTVGTVPTTASATILVEVPVDDMIWDADAIVLGEVVSVATRIEVDSGRPEPWTVTTIRVQSWLAGSGGPTHVLIEERGGVWQGGGMRIEGMPEYAVGERVVAFLQYDARGRARTYGMVQGKFVIRSGVGTPTTVERDLDDVGFAEWQGGRMTIVHREPAVLRLDALLSRIEQVRADRARIGPPTAAPRTVR